MAVNEEYFYLLPLDRPTATSHMQASNLQASNLQASNLQASNLQASNLQASNLQASNLQAYNFFVSIHTSAAFIVVILYLLALNIVHIYILVDYDQNLSDSVIGMLFLFSVPTIIGLIGVWCMIQWNITHISCLCTFLSAIIVSFVLGGIMNIVNLIVNYPILATKVTYTFAQHYAIAACLFLLVIFGYICEGHRNFVAQSCLEYSIKRFSWIFMNTLMCVSNIENCITVILYDDFITYLKNGYIVLIAISIVASISTITAIINLNQQHQSYRLYDSSTIIQLICNWTLAITYIAYVVDKVKNGEDYNFYFMMLMNIILSCLYFPVYLISMIYTLS